MLDYTFSKREKVLLVILALIAIGILYYQVIYRNVQDQLDSLNSQISEAQDETVTATAKLSKMKTMQAAIDSYKAAGLKATEMPSYDNITPLMAELNTTLASSSDYTLSFDDVDTSSTTVERGVDLTFGASSYASARSILDSLLQGSYPCSLDEFTITDNSAEIVSSTKSSSVVGSGTTSSSNVSVTAHFTFYEQNGGSTSSSSSSSSDTATNSSSDTATSLATSMGMTTSSTYNAESGTYSNSNSQ
jgi:uncharacterized protein YxeA